MTGHGWALTALIELIALMIGVALWWTGHMAWYLVPFFLVIPPIVVFVVGIFWLVAAEAGGENPFQ